ncbi:hypothetical protein B0J11DRAFT_439430, partial [Dendryphion nanum]
RGCKWYGKYGCTRNWCWMSCSYAGDWCWTAVNNGNGHWAACSTAEQCNFERITTIKCGGGCGC